MKYIKADQIYRVIRVLPNANRPQFFSGAQVSAIGQISNPAVYWYV